MDSLNGARMTAREHALAIWQAAVDAARPQNLIREAFASSSLRQAVRAAGRIVVVGAGKAGAAMAAGVEAELGKDLFRVEGLVTVPAGPAPRLQRIRLHVAREAGINEPTAEGAAGAREILHLVASAGPEDVCLCLISGGGSALLPAPVEGVSLADKQEVTRLLHDSGATINEMNAVRKHLSRMKGGRLAEAFSGRALYGLIISDVVGDPLDVIASGPTVADPTTFADALGVLERYGLGERVPPAVRRHLERGTTGQESETPKVLTNSVHNLVIGSNALSLAAASKKATQLGYTVINLGSAIEGETRDAAAMIAGVALGIRSEGRPVRSLACVLSGGETTVTLSPGSGLGGRNQEFTLAALAALWPDGLSEMTILSGGTDGEDGPTDAAGAIGDAVTLIEAERLGLRPEEFLAHHDAYHFFEATGGLLKTGLTQTNVMDVRVILVGRLAEKAPSDL